AGAGEYDQVNSRRSAMKSFARLSGKLALAAVPLGLSSVFQKTYANTNSTNDTVVEILNYALTLEYLEAEFYNMALASGGLIPGGAARGAIQTIANHENAHVTFLMTAIKSLSGTPVAKPKFDFSAGSGSGNGPFKDVFNNFDLFLSVAQTFEDTGVRAYKGRAAEIVQGGALLTAALQIHSVEARHAAHIRNMRKAYGSGVGNVKPWITGKMSNINTPAVQPSYDGEDLTIQATINIVNINGFAISMDAATEAFDEPLSKAEVLKIVGPFIAP
ncbi:MAG TPA: ferritin-like domain-containing protein, partial [Chitinophagaceae bacterium]|nr:ferritin-like domain-containing protein [Chitinophagaceae bacterium]